MFPCQAHTFQGRSVFFSSPVAPQRVTLNGNMFGKILELDAEVADEFGGVVLSAPELSPLHLSRLSDFYILILLL